MNEQEHELNPEPELEHEHKLADGTTIFHAHKHPHKHTKAILNRMSRLIGHLQSTRKMIEDGRDCSEVIIQLSAVVAAIKGVQRIILKDHLDTCIVDAIRDNDTETLDRLNKALDQFVQ